MSIAQRLRDAMREKKLSGAALARKAGVNPPTIHRILTGESASPRRDNVERLARALGVLPDWLFFGTENNSITTNSGIVPLLEDMQNVEQSGRGAARQTRKYPVISWVAASDWQESCDGFQPGESDEWIESDVNAGPHGYWLTVSGPSMEPKFTSGYRILVQPEGFDVISGKLYIARLKDTGETTFKQYLRDGGQGYLQPINPAFPILPITDNVEIIGRVIDGRSPREFF